MEPDEVCSVEIVDVALPNDYGVAKREGLVIFVPGAIPGDRVRVRLRREKKGYAYGELVEIEGPSPHRVDPVCPHFGRCGGCSLRSLDYGQQLLVKVNHLVQCLTRIGGIKDIQKWLEPIVPSVRTQHYRGMVELASSFRERRPRLGFRERVSPFSDYRHHVVAVQDCLIFSTVLRSVVDRFSGVTRPGAGKGGGPLPVLKGLTVREAKSTGQVMVVAEGDGPVPEVLPSMGRDLQPLLPGIASVYWVSAGRTTLVAGKAWIEERIGDLTFRIYPHAFFQPNPEGAALLHQKLKESLALTGQERILGLYCGAGPLELYLASGAKEVVGIDSLEANIAGARENCAINAIANCIFRRMAVENMGSKGEGGVFDVVVVDPPRTGMTEGALKAVLKVEAPRIAYVSCDPASLARDIKLLAAGGYGIERVIPFDFFPHTSHVEVLAILRK